MQHVFRGKKISAIVVAVPSQERNFEDEYSQYGLTASKAARMKEMMGLGSHRIAPENVTASDLCHRAAERLIQGGVLAKEDINALVFVSQTPDYFLPPTSNVLQGRLSLGRDVICLDLNQGCAGLLIGLMEAFLLLEIPSVRKVLLLAGDTASKQVSPRNRVSWPLLGDAGCAVVVEQADDAESIFMNLEMDGSRHNALMVPAGAYRKPCTVDTLREQEVEAGVFRSEQQIVMDGAAVFNFTIEDVPPQVRATLGYSADTIDSIDRFFFHQPNQFMLKQIGRKIGIPEEKLPSDIVGIYGNCSSVSIPLAICHHDSDLCQKRKRVCLSGFGVGLTWCTMVMNLGPLAVCEIVNHD